MVHLIFRCLSMISSSSITNRRRRAELGFIGTQRTFKIIGDAQQGRQNFVKGGEIEGGNRLWGRLGSG